MYINSQNQIYFGDCATGDRDATAEEVAAWELSRLPTVQDQLNTLDETYKLTQRNLRDFILLVTEAMKSGEPVDLSQVRGIQLVSVVEAQAEILRAQL